MPQTKPIVSIENVVASATVNQKMDLNDITKKFPDVEYIDFRLTVWENRAFKDTFFEILNNIGLRQQGGIVAFLKRSFLGNGLYVNGGGNEIFLNFHGIVI